MGTNGYGTIMSPATHPLVITVGAMNDKVTLPRGDDTITTYSSKGLSHPATESRYVDA